MKTTRYFEEQVLRKRPYIKREWCTDVVAAPLHRDERMAESGIGGRIIGSAELPPRFLRVVTLADGETIHSAFFDRNFREDER